MRKFVATTAGSLALVLATPSFAQQSETSVAEETAVDPVRLKAAEKTVDYLFPLGTYERMMKGTLDKIMDSVLGGMSGMTVGDMAGMSGVPG